MEGREKGKRRIAEQKRQGNSATETQVESINVDWCRSWGQSWLAWKKPVPVQL